MNKICVQPWVRKGTYLQQQTLFSKVHDIPGNFTNISKVVFKQKLAIKIHEQNLLDVLT